MLAAVRWVAVVFGAGAGGLVTVLLALVVWGILAAFGLEDAPLTALTFSLLAGFVVAGSVAGRMAIHSHRFHGMLAGLGLAAVIVVVSRLGGSPASTSRVLLLVAIALGLSGLGGVAAGRRAARPPVS
jgi:putative membrane protein (TIGR04086 family)